MSRKSSAVYTVRALALDISSKCVGWAIFDDGDLVAFNQYMPHGHEHGEKLVDFHVWLSEMFQQWEPTDVVYEMPYPGREKHAFGVLQMYVAALFAEHWMYFGREIPTNSRITPREVKRANGLLTGGTYKANKALAVAKVNELYQLKLKYDYNDRNKERSQDDTADAILLGRAWVLRYDPRLDP